MMTVRFGRAILAPALACLAPLLASGCTLEGLDTGMTPPPPPQKILATVTFVTGDAYIKRASGGEVPATMGLRLFDGDGFGTRNGRMNLDTPSGTHVEVFENTDPILQDAVCFTISFFNRGRIHVIGKGVCVDGVYQASDVGYEIVSPGLMRVWVLQGQARLVRPGGTVITTGQGMDVQRGQITRTFTFTPVEFSRRFPQRAIIG